MSTEKCEKAAQYRHMLIARCEREVKHDAAFNGQIGILHLTEDHTLSKRTILMLFVLTRYSQREGWQSLTVSH